MYPKIITEVNSKPPGIGLPEAAGINRTLADDEIIFIGSKNIAHAQCYDKFLLEELPVNACI